MKPLASLFFLLTALFVAFLPVTAQADDAKAQADPQQRFKIGQKLFEQGSFDEALAEFQAALAASGSPNARLYVARCMRELGELELAYEEMVLTVRTATELSERDKKYAPTRDAAAAELAQLEQRVARIVVELADPPKGSEVTINGKPLPSDRFGTPFAVAPGKVELSARAPGKKSVRLQAEVSAGEERTVAIALESEEPARTAPATQPEPSKPEEAPQKQSGGGLRVAGVVVAGVGVAGLALFAIAGSAANSKFETLESECGARRCSDPKYADVVDDGKRFDTLANVGLTVGVVGILTGGAMILFGGPASRTTERAGVEIAPNRLRISYEGRF